MLFLSRQNVHKRFHADVMIIRTFFKHSNLRTHIERNKKNGRPEDDDVLFLSFINSVR